LNKTRRKTRKIWIQRMAEFIPAFIRSHPVLGGSFRNAVVIFHGSTMMGIDDKGSDLDFWLLLPEKDLTRAERQAGTRFFSFEDKGKKGHLNAYSFSEFRDRVKHCDMDMIYQLRRAEVILDQRDTGAGLVRLAQRPMPNAVRRALFFYHYTEMRGEHRSCDNPMLRGDPAGVFFAVAKTVTHALQAALILDGQPFPYDKWLFKAALETPTGQLIASDVRKIFSLIRRGYLELRGHDRDNPISNRLRSIRWKLVKAAQKKGFHQLWLEKWWRFMTQAEDARLKIRW
jgi:hypothetical protein